MERSRSYTGERKYRNNDITVYWKSSACVHASYCYRELIEVFDPGRRPWVDMGGATTERIIEVVNLCPTEALTWRWNDDAKNQDVEADQTNHVKFKRPELIDDGVLAGTETPLQVKVMVDGPLIIKGNFTLTYDGNRKEVAESLVSICRCGESDHQPFCDGRHRMTGFNG